MDYNITEICSPHSKLEISLSLKPVKVPYFTSLQIRSPTETIFERTYSDFSAVQDLMKILEIPEKKIEILDIGGCVFNQDEFLDRLLKALDQRKIRVDTVHFHNTIKCLTAKHVELLRNFDSEVLYGIEINTEIDDEILQEMAGTEQWKKAKKLTIFGRKSLKETKIDNFLHFEKVYLIDCPKPSADNCWKIIQSFRQRQLPPGSFFDISGTSIDVDAVIEMFDVPSKCEKKDSVIVKHIQHFQLEDGEILELRLYEDRIWGRKGKKEDMKDF